MRHAKHTFKIGRTAAHRRCMLANMLKSLLVHGRIVTTVVKAKELRRHADRLITLAKRDTLASRRRAVGELMICFHPLTTKEERSVRQKGADGVYHTDRTVIGKLFGEYKERFAERAGGYTRIVRGGQRRGDNAPCCIIEYLPE